MVKIMMKDDSIIDFEGYDDIPKYLGQELLFFGMYGDHQGDRVMVSKKDDDIMLWRSYYGSCSGCDDYEDFASWGENIRTKEEGDKFVYAYSPELTYKISEITEENILEFLKKQDLREDYNDLTEDRYKEEAKKIFTSIPKK